MMILMFCCGSALEAQRAGEERESNGIENKGRGVEINGIHAVQVAMRCMPSAGEF